MKQIAAIEVPQYDEKLVAAVRAADKVLGWDSTGVLLWLVSPQIHGRHILVHDEDEVDGSFLVSPRLGECSWRFRLSADELTLRGWGHEDIIELSPSHALALSSGRYWVKILVSSDGGISVETDDLPSAVFWADKGTVPAALRKSARAARIYDTMAALEAAA